MHIIFQNCSSLFGKVSSVILPQANAVTNPQVTIEDRRTFLLDKFINLPLFHSKVQVLKIHRLWREFNQLLAIEGTFLISSEQNGGTTEDIIRIWYAL